MGKIIASGIVVTTRNTKISLANKESFWICMPRGPGIRRHCEGLWQEEEQLIFILAGTG